MKKESNYKKLNEQWRLKFLEMDKAALQRRIPSLRRENCAFTIRQFDRCYSVSEIDGEICPLSDTQPVTETEKLNIYTFFYFCSDHAAFQNIWLPFRELRGAGVFGPAFQKGVNEVLAATFSGHSEALGKALQQLSGQKIGFGNVGFQLPSFEEIPIRILFWDGDDEFPAQANMLFDASSVDFIHVESIVSLAAECVDRLAKLAGLPLRGSTFSMN